MLVHTAIPQPYAENIQNPASSSINDVCVVKTIEKKQGTIVVPLSSVPEKIVERKRKLTISSSSNNDSMSEKITLPSSKAQLRTFKIVVKPKTKPKSQTVMNYIKPVSATTKKDEERFFLTEEGNISSTNVDPKTQISEDEVDKGDNSNKKEKSPKLEMENYSEFIFNGEIYVQMPKRVFEQEKEKLLAESMSYKSLLMKMRHQIDLLLDKV
jgi:hypothetical protein